MRLSRAAEPRTNLAVKPQSCRRPAEPPPLPASPQLYSYRSQIGIIPAQAKNNISPLHAHFIPNYHSSPLRHKEFPRCRFERNAAQIRGQKCFTPTREKSRGGVWPSGGFNGALTNRRCRAGSSNRRSRKAGSGSRAAGGGDSVFQSHDRLQDLLSPQSNLGNKAVTRGRRPPPSSRPLPSGCSSRYRPARPPPPARRCPCSHAAAVQPREAEHQTLLCLSTRFTDFWPFLLGAEAVFWLSIGRP